MKAQRKPWLTHFVALLFILFQFIQVIPMSLSSSTVSAQSNSTTLFSDQKGDGEIEWDLSKDGKQISWKLTINQNEAEGEAAPYVEIKLPEKIGKPTIVEATLNGSKLNGSQFKLVNEKYVFHPQLFSTTTQKLQVTFTTSVEDASSASLSFAVGAFIQSKDNFTPPSLQSISVFNLFAQIEAERIAAEKAAQEEAERLAAEEAAAEKKAQEEAERVAAEKVAKEEAEREAAEKEQSEEESKEEDADNPGSEPQTEVEDEQNHTEKEMEEQEPNKDTTGEEEITPEEEKENSEDSNLETEKKEEINESVESEKNETKENKEVIEEEADYYIEGGKEIYTLGSPTTDGLLPVSKQAPLLQHSSAKIATLSTPINYTTDAEGTYPSSYSQDGSTVRNHSPQPVEYDAGSLKKTASETTVPGQYDITLEVSGKTITESETTDIVLVLDNSNSMADNNRVTIASDAATDFIEGLLNPTTNPNGAIRMALVTYASQILNNHSSTTLTTNPNNLTTVLPWDANNGQIGGTLTQAALRQARLILNSSTATNKIVIFLSDGLPTLSYQMNSATANGPLVNYEGIPNFYNFYGTSMNYNTIKGDGTRYYLGSSIFTPPQHQDYSVNGYTVEDHFIPTMSEAIFAKNAGIDLYGVGIELTDQTVNNQFASREQALTVMKNVATNDNYYYDASQAAQIQTILEQLSNTVTKSISNGSIVDPMGEQIILDKGPDGNFDSADYTLQASNPNLLNSVQVTENPDGTINVTGLNLGADEWVRLIYTIHLDTEDPSFIPDFYYQTNGETLLTPVANTPGITNEFPIPSIKAPGWSLNGEKFWENDTPSDRPDSILLNLFRTAEGTTNKQFVSQITVSEDTNEDWLFEADSLARFDNLGRAFTYSIEEEVIADYLTSIESVTEDTSQSGVLNVTLTNTLLTGSFAIEKVDEEGNPIIGEDLTAEFTLSKDGAVIGTYTTNSLTGRINFEDLRIGTYSLSETSPPAGYEGMSEDVEIDIRLDEDDIVRAYVNGEIITTENPLRIENVLKVGSLTIEKIDNSSQEPSPLAEAEFELRVYTTEDEYTVFATGTTDAQGLLVFEDIPHGEYVLVETIAPEGYQLQDDSFSITINDETPHVTLTVVNKPSAELPNTGSMGTTLFTVLGLALMGGTLYGLNKKKKKNIKQ